MTSIQTLIQNIKASPIETTGEIYHPIPFKEFEGLKSATHPKAAQQKFQLMHNMLPFETLQNRAVLDIGANAGFFSYKFAQAGAHVEAIEPHPRYFELGQAVSEHHAIDVHWDNNPIEESFLEGKKYDVAIMLSVFQWISKGNSELDFAKSLLRNLSSKTDYLFFELGCNWGKSAINVQGPAIFWIYDLLKKNTPYQNIVYLGSITAWGNFKTIGRYRRYLFGCTNHSANLSLKQKFLTKGIVSFAKIFPVTQ